MLCFHKLHVNMILPTRWSPAAAWRSITIRGDKWVLRWTWATKNYPPCYLEKGFCVVKQVPSSSWWILEEAPRGNKTNLHSCLHYNQIELYIQTEFRQGSMSQSANAKLSSCKTVEQMSSRRVLFLWGNIQTPVRNNKDILRWVSEALQEFQSDDGEQENREIYFF